MSRGTYVYRNGKVVPKESAGPREDGGKKFHVISDDLGADLDHHGYADGRKTASKSEFRRWTKEAGLFEKGNDREPARPVQDKSLASDVAQAIQMVRQGYKPTLGREWD